MGKLCVYCGEPLSKSTATKDHIVPRAFFSGENNGLQKTKVPACISCNNEKSELESYLLMTMATSLSENDPEFGSFKQEAWKRIDPRSTSDEIEKRKRTRHVENTLKGMSLMDPNKPGSGRPLPMLNYPVPRDGKILQMKFDGSKLTLFTKKIIQALCFRYLNKGYVPLAHVDVQYLGVDAINDLLRKQFPNVRLDFKRISFGKTVLIDHLGAENENEWRYIFIVIFWKKFFTFGWAGNNPLPEKN